MKRRIFVFGSNTEGRHGKGAALEAVQKWKAVYGQARGLQGDAYAIVTKDLSKGKRSVSLIEIAKEVLEFIEFAKFHPTWEFILSPIGCGLAGYTPREIAPLFRYAPSNIWLPDEFQKELDNGLVMAVTGHRPDKLGGEYDYEGPYSNYLLNEFRDILRLYKPKYIITGMAIGVDTLWVLAAMLENIPFIAAIPFEGQECKWNDEQKLLYKNILDHPLCLEKRYICSPGYSVWKMQKRNEWMVDNCDILVQVWDRTSGGTANCIKYANQVNRKRIDINLSKIKIK
jgi:uncharacterized phage-like protein YoqJ